MLRLSRPTGWTISLSSVCGQRRYLRSISWLFSASASRKNGGYSVIPACGFSSRHNAKPLFAWFSSKAPVGRG